MSVLMYSSSTLHFLFIFNIYTGTKRFVTQFNTRYLCIRRVSQLNAHWKGLDTYSAEVPYRRKPQWLFLSFNVFKALPLPELLQPLR